ncbi:LysR family transcriptional regulator [Tardiphaga alba]|uniref:LysR family transcriptional regulator n=1 Tax=Tardiphaga alba TaxID=340268 RepID=A0ABX8ACX8_9BRAD|nr:LysR family transcriptional regulator [Tardiphaga alba]QUS41122.1 LysR family transcriptional regulator [Tardiphaga alba]
MELRQLRQFVMLAETMNFRRAADRLNMAQPALSVSIRKLEDELRAPLFERSTRDMRLTAFGKLFLDHARRTLFEADQALRIAQSAAIGEAGTLSIGFVGTATYAALPRLIPAHRAAFPHVQLQLRESTSSEILAQIEQGSMDLGIVRAPVARTTECVLQTIEEDHLVLALHRDHPLAARDDLSLADLREEPFVTYSAAIVPSLHAMLSFACQNAGFVPKVSQEAVQVQTVISLVDSGLGVALVPSAATRNQSSNVRFRQLPDLQTMAPISLAIAHAPKWETAASRNFRALAATYRLPRPGDGLSIATRAMHGNEASLSI